MFEYDSIIHHQDAATQIQTIGESLLSKYRHRLDSIKHGRPNEDVADPENANEWDMPEEHGGHHHGTINHNNQARLTLLILNMAYMTKSQQENLVFDQNVDAEEVIILKNLGDSMKSRYDQSKKQAEIKDGLFANIRKGNLINAGGNVKD